MKAALAPRMVLARRFAIAAFSLTLAFTFLKLATLSGRIGVMSLAMASADVRGILWRIGLNGLTAALLAGAATLAMAAQLNQGRRLRSPTAATLAFLLAFELLRRLLALAVDMAFAQVGQDWLFRGVGITLTLTLGVASLAAAWLASRLGEPVPTVADVPSSQEAGQLAMAWSLLLGLIAWRQRLEMRANNAGGSLEYWLDVAPWAGVVIPLAILLAAAVIGRQTRRALAWRAMHLSLARVLAVTVPLVLASAAFWGPLAEELLWHLATLDTTALTMWALVYMAWLVVLGLGARWLARRWLTVPVQQAAPPARSDAR